MCLSFVPPCITTCIANEDKRDDKRRSSLLFLHTFPIQHAYLYAITEVYVCYERTADIHYTWFKHEPELYCLAVSVLRFTRSVVQKIGLKSSH